MEKVATAAGRRSGEALGLAAAVLSTVVGGITIAVTRFAVGAVDPLSLASLRFGLGFLLLLPIALLWRCRWPARRDWLGVALLGLLFFGLFFVLFNLALRYTSAARGALALSTLPLVTMLMGALLGAEALGLRKSLGVLIAFSGVALALLSGLAAAPRGAWRGDLIMVCANICMALYSVLSRPLIARSSPLGFLTAGMGVGALAVTAIAAAAGGFGALAGFGADEWLAILYLAVMGAALTFFLWVFALTRISPTKVANAITLNPVTAAITAAVLLREPIGAMLLFGIVAVSLGILVASSEGVARR